MNLQQDGILPTQETWQGTINGSIQRRYNADFRLESLTISGFPISYSYDNDGLLTQAGTMIILIQVGVGIMKSLFASG